MSTKFKKLGKRFFILLITVLIASGCSRADTSESIQAAIAEQTDIQILATSDLHGKFLPWDYLLDKESKSGSMTQLATAIREKRNDNTIVIDAGDTIQDNYAELFLDDDIHPMIEAMNYIGYDTWTTGNHEYNYGMDILKKVIRSQKAAPLAGNVYDQNGERLGKPYEIIERGGIRIAVIGMVTPYITKWDKTHLNGWKVTNPVEECEKLKPELEKQADVYIAAVHMGLEREHGVPGSGARELAEACPWLDVIIASHDHLAIEGERVGNVLIVENKNQAQTMSEIHLTVEKGESGCTVVDKTSKIIELNAYEPDAALTELLTPKHLHAIEESHKVIGRLEGGDLLPENEIQGIPSAAVQDTAWIDLILKTELYYSGADVAAAALTLPDTNFREGDIRKCDVAGIYKFINTLYSLRMSGSQLKTYMEWSAQYYQQYHEGDLTIGFNPDFRSFNYDMFAGITYEIDISKPAGERIVNLKWPDGKAVRDDDSFVIAVNNYRCNSLLLQPGIVFQQDDMPELLETDIHGSDIGGVREMITDYIIHVSGGVITPETDNNWRIVGNNWDEDLHKKAVEQINSGLIKNADEEGRIYAVTIQDLIYKK